MLMAIEHNQGAVVKATYYRSFNQLTTWVMVFGLLLSGGNGVWAHSLDHQHFWHQDRRPLSPEQARQARKKGQVQSLRTVLKEVQTQFPGQLLKAELRDYDDQWVYTLIMLQEGGYLTKIWVDAQSGIVLQHKSRKKHSHRKRHERNHHENSGR